ncbi:STAS domain-containing protein [Actinomadura rayongensis]|nr:STAS domain-containing protein [Actinomadura rayongensis]
MMADDRTTAERRTARRGPGAVRCRAGALAPGEPGYDAGFDPGLDTGRDAGDDAGTVPWATWTRPGLEIATERVRDGVVVASVSGEIDLHTADRLRARLIGLHAAGRRSVVVDFAGVPFCDAAGLGALVAAHNDVVARGGAIRLARMRPAQERLVRITGLHRLFPVHATLDEAVAEATKALP